MTKRIFPMLLVAMAAALAPATASAQEEGEEDVAHKVKGTVVSVDSAAGTLQVELGGRGPCRGGRGGRGGPRGEGGEDMGAGVSQRRGGPRGRRGGRGARGQRPARTVTVSTDGSTRIRRNRAAASLGDLAAGDKVTIVILTDEETSLEQALSEPADVISAKAPRQQEAQQEDSDQPQGEAEQPQEQPQDEPIQY